MLNQVFQISEQMLELIQSDRYLDRLDRFETLEQQRKAILKEYSDQQVSEELQGEDAALLVKISQLSDAIELAANNIKSDLRSKLIGNRKNQKNIMAYS